MDFSDILYFSRHPYSTPPRRAPHVEQQYQAIRHTEHYELRLHNEIFVSEDIQWTMVLNSYPYHFIDDTKHYVIWYRGDIVYDDFKIILDGMGAVHFENKHGDKSVKTINHFHVFFKSQV